ncbi:hypothetical protein GCM10009119_43710 [Algoriphagus jejuensis]|uniref:Beta-lactamase-related domain-containing protein n=1 Tax=Algoriphagus jejuensis TaxID=419934 RepID=A0ABP3YLA8_9BACT
MKWKIKYSILGLAFWFLLFLTWEWWSSYPRVRLTPVSHPKSREARVDSILIQSLSDFLIPGVAVGIVENEKIIYLKAFGYENLATKDSLSLQSPLPVASVSKIFTALSLSRYALENGIEQDTILNAILPRGKKLPEEFNWISLRDLLTHQSGITVQRNLKTLLISSDKRKLNLLPYHLSSPDLNDKTYHYADVNFDLIGYALETSSGQPFDSLIKENTLDAAGMFQSHFLTEEHSDTASFAGYKQTVIWKRIQSTKLKIERYPSPSSGLVVTAEELSKALLHLCRGSMGTFSRELNWLQGNTEMPAGFQQITIGNTQFIGHFGEQDGFSAILIYSPSQEIGLFILANSRDKPDFRRQISAGILKVVSP